MDDDCVDYGYEPHEPYIYERSCNGQLQQLTTRSNSFGSDLSTSGEFHIDTTEVTQSPSQNHDYSSSYYDDMNNNDNNEADRIARKQQHRQSFRRRNAAIHGDLLKSAVMASMTDNEYPRRGSVQSSISLQSLQDALRLEAISPRKRARRVRRVSPHEDNNNDEQCEAVIEQAGNLLSNTLRLGDSLAISVGPRAAPARREPPVRRVSRKTSVDSRVSAYDDDSSVFSEED
jgi:hypothetical protein